MPTSTSRKEGLDGIPGGENDGYRSGDPPLVGRREDSGHRAIDRYGPEHGAADRAFSGGGRNPRRDAVARGRQAAADTAANGSARCSRGYQRGRADAEITNPAD